MPSTPSSPQLASPERIIDIAIGFMGAKQLFAASRTGLFSAIAAGAGTAEEISLATGTPERQMRILTDSMTSLGLLERADGRYTLAPDARDYLTGGQAGLNLAPFLSFLDSVSYEQWREYDGTVETDAPGTLDLDEAGWSGFMQGVMTYNKLHAAQLADSFDFTGYHRLLDLGGLSPEFSIQALLQAPRLAAEFVVAPAFVDSVREALAEAGMTKRAGVEGADTETARPAGPYDLIMVNHVAHRFDADTNAGILARARAAAAEGATLLLLDFFLDDDPTQRKIDALHAGEYYNIDGTVVYPLATVRTWLTDAGWRLKDVLCLPGSPRVLVAQAE